MNRITLSLLMLAALPARAAISELEFDGAWALKEKSKAAEAVWIAPESRLEFLRKADPKAKPGSVDSLVAVRREGSQEVLLMRPHEWAHYIDGAFGNLANVISGSYLQTFFAFFRPIEPPSTEGLYPSANFEVATTKRFPVPLFLPSEDLPDLSPEWTRLTGMNLIAQVSPNMRDFQIVRRAEWGAMNAHLEAMLPLGPRNSVKAVVFHQTVTPISDGRPFGVVRGIQQFHLTGPRLQGGQGPCAVKGAKPQATDKPGDIGYHFLITQGPDKHWQIIEGRELKYQGAHAGMSPDCRNLNPGTVGVAFVMNTDFKRGDNPDGHLESEGESAIQPPPEALFRAAQLVRYLQAEFPELNQVYGHGTFQKDEFGQYLGINPAHTACPGPGAIQAVQALRRKFSGRANLTH